jgi:hypothetical protein
MTSESQLLAQILDIWILVGISAVLNVHVTPS